MATPECFDHVAIETIFKIPELLDKPLRERRSKAERNANKVILKTKDATPEEWELFSKCVEQMIVNNKTTYSTSEAGWNYLSAKILEAAFKYLPKRKRIPSKKSQFFSPYNKCNPSIS